MYRITIKSNREELLYANNLTFLEALEQSVFVAFLVANPVSVKRDIPRSLENSIPAPLTLI